MVPGAGSGPRWIPGLQGGRAGWALAVVSGLLLVLCFPPFHLGAVPFVALVPLAVVVARSDPLAWRDTTRTGFMAGLVAWGVLLRWIPTALWPVTPWAPGLYLVLVGCLALFVAFFAGSAALLTSHRVPLWLAIPVSWTGWEWARAHLGPLAFPWLELGTGFWHSPILAGPAELVGVRGLSFWAAAVSGLVAAGLLARGRRRAVLVGAAVVLLILPASWSRGRLAGLEVRALARVAVVQPDLRRGDRVGSGEPAMERLQELATGIPNDVDLVVWPEAVFTRDPRRDPGLASRIDAWVDRVDAPLIFGAYLEEADEGRLVTYNGALVWLPGRGPAGMAYRKRRLVPGVESMPFIDPNRPGMSHRFAAFARGSGPGVLSVPGLPALAALICYESIFSQDGRRAATEGARALVNLTNDEWFAGPAGSRITDAFAQHPAHLIVRAVEVRQGAVRAANTGLSLFVDPGGRVQARLEPHAPGVLVDTLYGAEGPTLYTEVGDLLGCGSAVLLALGLLAAGLARVRDRSVPGSGGSA